jgi:mRNA interferase MazF
MVTKKYVPHTGDIVWIDLNPTRGHEQSKLRPALVVSPKAYNQKTSLALMCPITSQIKGYPFEVTLSHKKIEGVILVDQIRSLDWVARKAKYIGSVGDTTMILVRQKLMPLIE